jgi:hypothetical protein
VTGDGKTTCRDCGFDYPACKCCPVHEAELAAADALAKAATEMKYALEAIQFGSLEARFDDLSLSPQEIAEKYLAKNERALAAYEKVRGIGDGIDTCRECGKPYLECKDAYQ